jgi:tetratricopeptide (TPR) repeat protein
MESERCVAYSCGVPLFTSIDPENFIAAVKPKLEASDMDGLLALLKSRWTPDQIVSLLACNSCDARKVAALALSLVGGKCCVPPLVAQLKDGDRMVNEMAEHALWAIWLRGSDRPEANHQVARGSQAIDRRDFEHALEHFDNAIELDPAFAEAYNQRAIAHYLQEHYEDSARDCQRAIDLMPSHFGALAGLGHSYAHLGRLKDALGAYQRALEINPHLSCVREMIEELTGKGS